MKKNKLIILYPFFFKKYNWRKFEIDQLISEKDIKLEIHELINIIAPKKIKPNNQKEHKIILRFKKIDDWINFIEKETLKYNIFILNDNINPFNKNSFLVKKKIYDLKKRDKLKIIEFRGAEVPESSVGIFKNLFKFLKRVFLKPSFFISSLKAKTFSKLDKWFIQSILPNYIIATNSQKLNLPCSNKVNFVEGSSIDYSNHLIFRKKKTRIFKKKFAIYIDSPLPEGSDINIMNYNFPFEIKTWFKSLNTFFNFIENKFNIKIVIAPHPKNDIKILKKIYKGREITKHPLALISKHSDFFISRNSTAISFAVIHKKPLFLVGNNEHKKKVYYRDLELYRDISKELKCGIVNIDEKYNKKILQKKLKINQKSYHSYKINYLKHAKTEQPNSKILAKLIRSTN